MRACLYTRVSTADQNAALQRAELRAYVGRMGWTIAREYIETGSGANAARPHYNELLEASGRPEPGFDVVMVWKLDRFGRSLIDCLSGIRRLQGNRIRFVAVTQGIDTDASNPASRFLVNILAAAAEFERELIHERVLGGLAEYRAAYKRGDVGRTRHSRSGKDLEPGRPKRIVDREAIARARSAGLSWPVLAKRLGVSESTARRRLNQ